MRLAVCVLMALCVLSGSAYAATIYTDEAAFLAAIAPGYYLENFTTFSDGDPLGGDPSPLDYDSPVVNGFSWNCGALDGLWSLQNAMSAAYPYEELTITFTGAPVSAVGGFFAATDYAGEVIEGSGVMVVLPDGTSQSVSGSGFVGFTSDTPISQLSVIPQACAEGNWSAFWHLYSGCGSGNAQLPEPSCVACLLMGIASLGSIAGLRRLRRR